MKKFEVAIWIDCIPYLDDYDRTYYFETFPEMVEFLNNVDVSEMVSAKPYMDADIRCQIIYLGELGTDYQVIATYTIA